MGCRILKEVLLCFTNPRVAKSVIFPTELGYFYLAGCFSVMLVKDMKILFIVSYFEGNRNGL